MNAKPGKFSLLLLLVIITSFTFKVNNIFAQSQFQLTIGGSSNEFAQSMIQTSDGGYAIAGYTESFGAGNADFYIVKLDANNNVQWTRTVGGTGNEYIRGIIQCTDGSYVAAGYGSSFGAGNEDIYIVKLDQDGTVLWIKTIGGSGNERAYSIVLNSDGGYTISGYTNSFGLTQWDAYIVKLDASGGLIWSKTIGDSDKTEIATCMVQTSDGGYAFAGYTGSSTTNSIDYYIVKLDAYGTPEWSRTIGETAHDYAWSIIQTSDGGVAVTGYCQGFGAGASDMYVVKLNLSGTVEWTRTIGGTGSDAGWTIKQLSDGSYIITGQTNSFGAGGTDVYIVKLNSSGTLQWSKTVGSTNHDVANCLIQTSDGGFATLGTTYIISGGWYALADMNVVKYNGNWKTCSNNISPKSKSGTGGTVIIDNRSSSSQVPEVTTQDPIVSNGGTLAMVCSGGGGHHSPQSKITNNDKTQLPFKFGLEQNYPNPFNPKTTISFQLIMFSNVKLIIYDILGNEIETLVNGEMNPGMYEVSWDATNYPSGIYIYRFESEYYNDSKKMLLIK